MVFQIQSGVLLSHMGHHFRLELVDVTWPALRELLALCALPAVHSLLALVALLALRVVPSPER